MKVEMRHIAGALASAAVLLLAGCAQSSDTMDAMPAPMAPMSMDRNDVQRITASWHPAANEAALSMTDMYGPPMGVTDNMMVWGPSGPWKRIIVYREAVDHDFPMPHPDVLEQFIDYRAPLDRYDELAMFDGSVIVERTKGEMSARCDKEGANFLAVNLADEVATGRRTVDDARRVYGEQIKAMKAGQPAPYTQRLMFTPPPSGNDSDHPIID